jgi:tetratricopeptide (TPR) repeat protein
VVDEGEPNDIGHAPTVESTPEDRSDELGSAASLLRGLADAPGGPIEGPLRPGQRVADKYEVERAVGEGGMGVVYLARDVRLERDIALKVGSAISSAGLARMEREAQTLARLSHPNVVVIHEVGEVEGRAFVAMEHVAGGTARTWLRAKPRTTREIVTLFCAAGDGLAAAHAAGIVHRDFKPDNVLVGEDGRPRVADFGLAREVAGDVDEQPDKPSIEITRAGAIVGTPAYMAPEQLAGEAVDARADQFAFAAALWEALYGLRPFPGNTPDEVKAAIETSEPRTAAKDRRVPRDVELALRRALRPIAADRWPSLAGLLAELRHDRARRRRTFALAAGGLVLVAAGVTVPLVMRGPAPCTDDAAALAPTWNDTRAAALAHAFAAVNGATVWTSLRPRVDHYAQGWIAAHHDACKATRIDGSQSEALLDRRMMCLIAARAQLEAVLAGWTANGRSIVAQAPDDLGVLPDIAACGDTKTLGKQTPLPADPKVRAAIEKAFTAIATAGLAYMHDDAHDPVDLGNHTLAAATATGWSPVIARATVAKASLELRAGATDQARADLQQAATLATAGGDDVGAAWAMAHLADSFVDDRRAADAKPWLALANALHERIADDPELDTTLLGIEAQLAMLSGDPNTMLDASKRAYDITARAFPADGYQLAAAHRNVALAYQVAGRWPEAIGEIQLALTAAETGLGKDHPYTASTLGELAQAEGHIGKLDDARAHARQAAAALEAWYGPDHHVASELDSLAVIEMNRGDQPAARAAFDRELAILHEHDPKSPRLPDVETNYGVMLATFGHLADAMPHAEQGLAGHLATLGRDNPQLNTDYTLVAYIQRGTGKLADAERNGRESVRVVENKLGANHPDSVGPRTELSYTLVAEGKYAEAAALLEPMVALAASSNDVPPPAAAEVHMAYADALWRAGGDRTKARAEATASRDAFAALGTGFKPQSDQAATWLANHR